MYKSKLESIGVKLPEKKVSSKEIMSQLKHKVNFDLEELTGIKERRFCSENEDSLTLAVDAAKDCLKYSEYSDLKKELLRYDKDGKLWFIYTEPVPCKIRTHGG